MSFLLEKIGSFYKIKSSKFPKFKLGKKDKNTDVQMTDGPDSDDQLWALMPKYVSELQKVIVI